MFTKTSLISALACSLIFTFGQVQAADQTKDQVKDQTKDQTQLRDRDQIYGSQLMTEQERIEHRNKMRSMKTQKEREAYQLEHHKLMQERAKAKGVTLPDERPMRPGNMGSGGGMGGGMGSGKQ
jgi:hypothetical protein